MEVWTPPKGVRRARTAFQWKDVSAERPSTLARAGVAVQVLTPLAFVAKTGRPMWSARTKEMTPPSMTATGSQPFQTYSRIAPEVSWYLAMRRAVRVEDGVDSDGGGREAVGGESGPAANVLRALW